MPTHIKTTLRPLAYGLFAAALATGASQALACDKPRLDLDMPDGKTASETEMIAAQQQVNAFVKAGESYIACIEGSASAMKERNDTIDEMEKAAALFNRQLRYFKRRG